MSSDGSIEFTSNTGITFATTRAAITNNAYDLIGVAEHEIGHLLGFDSALDLNSASRSALDLFRYLSPSVLSFTTGQAAYFSIDGGATNLGSLSVGGAGEYQASHWLLGIGALLDPAIAAGSIINITPQDIVALDAIGWDAAIPEPASAAILLASLGLFSIQRRRHPQTA